jgi:glycolate oxidase FAD binding subunit
MQTFAPATEAEAAAIIAQACAQRRPLSIEGNGSKRGLGRLIETPSVLKMSGLQGIVAYEPEELVVTVRAGTPLAEVEAALAEKKQCLAFEPGSWSFDPDARPTIGGTVAAGVAGARRVVLGGARDHLIGFRAVNGEGQVFKAGGKVVKNVTGYDLPKLAAGSFGTLFAMTELTLRTYPRTITPTSLFVRDLNIDAACSLLRQVAGSPWEATGLCYVPRVALERLGDPFDVAHSFTVVRFEGNAESMSARARGCVVALAAKADLVSDEHSQFFWRHLLQLTAFKSSPTLWRISLPPLAAPEALAALRADSFIVDWAGGLIWIEHGGAVPSVDVHEVASQLGGHAMLFRGSDEMRRNGPVFPPRDAATMEVTRRLKDAFDPARVFNPGRMYAGV